MHFPIIMRDRLFFPVSRAFRSDAAATEGGTAVKCHAMSIKS